MSTNLKKTTGSQLATVPSADSQFATGKAMARGLAAKFPSKVRWEIARGFCISVLTSHWNARCREIGCNWAISSAPNCAPPDDPKVIRLALELGEIAASFNVEKACYLLGTVYTAMLPGDVRAKFGAFYTPLPYVHRLLDTVAKTGFDWSKGKAIDPACGGGVFMAPIALRMLQACSGGSAKFKLANIANRLRGVEIDPFAAWMSHVLLETALLPLCVEAKTRMPNLISVGDSLALTTLGGFDLVIGNPPYGRITLAPEQRKSYSRSLYGHANLYGLFTDLAVRLAKPNGVIAYVTPTSFLGGQYFKALRSLLVEMAPPQYLDFVHQREGVFDDVLQETLLAVYHKGAALSPVQVSCLSPHTQDTVNALDVGQIDLAKGSHPWLLPRYPEQADFFAKLCMMSCRLHDFGYSVSTGPLVWNRHKSQLRTSGKGKNVFPLIWAESITGDGFSYSAQRRSHVPFIQVTDRQKHLLRHLSCVLVQRTTAKEQNRRLIAAVMPDSFISSFGAVVVENHLNVVFADQAAQISPKTIAAVLNSRAVDTAFRCISGSVAVSAYELNALPLPNLAEMMAIDKLVRNDSDTALIEKKLDRIYGLNA